MNHIQAIVTAIEQIEHLSIVNFEAASQPMQMVALELSENVVVGATVILSAKATHIILAKELQGELSISNRLHVTVERVQNGSLFSSVTLRFGETFLESIITKASSSAMNLQDGDEVTALINASALSVIEVIS